MPTAQGISNVKANLLRPALTSHYDVYIGLPQGQAWNGFASANLIVNQNKLHLSCCEATLPGSSLATMEINNDFHGVTERHVHRRLFDDRIDLSFYVDAENYMPIRFFETWIKFAANEQLSGENNIKQSNYTYSMRYPSEYIGGDTIINKFERDYKSKLTYHFVDPFPISVSSMPISYEQSSLLKCTVSLTYLRYYVEPKGSGGDASRGGSSVENPPKSNVMTPNDQAILNMMSFATSPNDAALEANYYNTLYGEA